MSAESPSKKRDRPHDEASTSAEADLANGDTHSSEPCQAVDRSVKRQKTADRLPKRNDTNYPSLRHSSQARLNSAIRITDLQNLVLYLLADGPHQQWVTVQHRHSFDKVVVIMVPGLDMDILDTAGLSRKDGIDITKANNPDDYYPVKLDADALPVALRPLADMFPHVWPVKTPGQLTHMHSPLSAMLSCPLPKPPGYNSRKSGPKPPIEAKHWRNQPVSVAALIATKPELHEHGFAIHAHHLASATERANERARRHKAFQGPDDGWSEMPATTVNLDPGDESSVLVVDCEMVSTKVDKFALARVSLVNWQGDTILDELIKPPDPVIDYLTQYSGITPDMLKDVTMTLPLLKDKLQAIFTPGTILAGHSLDSDLKALKLVCPFVIDTSILYPHPKGLPAKSSLKWLCEKYLSKSIQNHGAKGHDSVEDALSCLALVKQKCERGKTWGTSDATNESLLKRLARPTEVEVKSKVDRKVVTTTETRVGKSSAIVDWGEPLRGFGATASMAIACETDADVVAGVKKAVSGNATEEGHGGVDFIWARLRELEAFRGWWNSSKTGDSRERLARTLEAAGEDLQKTAGETVARIHEIWSALPERTAFIVYSGSGDPREMSRLMTLHADFKRAYQTMKWDELPVRWTDVEEQQLKTAVARARSGIGFIGVTLPKSQPDLADQQAAA